MPTYAGSIPPSIDAVHTWTPATGPAFSVNSQGGVSPPALPYARIDNIQGWYSLPDIDDSREGLTGLPGERVLPTQEGGKTVVYEVTVIGVDLPSLAGKLQAMRNSFGSNRKEEGVMTVVGSAAWGGGTWQFSARCIQLDGDTNFDYVPNRWGPWRWSCQIGLRMSLPNTTLGGVTPPPV